LAARCNTLVRGALVTWPECLSLADGSIAGRGRGEDMPSIVSGAGLTVATFDAGRAGPTLVSIDRKKQLFACQAYVTARTLASVKLAQMLGFSAFLNANFKDSILHRAEL